MKAKTIKKILAAKVDSLADYVAQYLPDGNGIDKFGNKDCWKDPSLSADIRDGTIVTGGCIVSMLLKEKPNDYDFYFKNRNLAMRVAKFFMWLFNEQTGQKTGHYICYRMEGDEKPDPGLTRALPSIKDTPSDDLEGILDQHGWRRHFVTPVSATQTPGLGRFKIMIQSTGIASTQEPGKDHQYFEQFPDEMDAEWIEALTRTDDVEADTLENKEEAETKGRHHPKFMSANAITLAGKIQLITRFWGDAVDIHSNHDFVHCTCSYNSGTNVLTLPQEALEAIITKELRYVGSLYPLCSIIRIRKFVARGWQINAGQILKMAMQLNDLDLRDLEVLEDQLIGVDAAYFQQIINRLREKQDEKIASIMSDENVSRTEAEEKAGSIDASYLMTIIDRIF